MRSSFRAIVSLLTLTFLLNTTAVLLLAQQEEPALARVLESGDAYIAFDQKSHTWELGNNAIRRRMIHTEGSGFRLTRFTNKVTGREWLAGKSSASSELRIVIDNQTIIGSDPDLAYKEFKTQKLKDGSLELVVNFQHLPLEIYVHYILFPRTSVIEQWVEVANIGADVMPNLTALDSFSVALRPSADPLTLYWIHGLDPSKEDQTSNPIPALRQRSLKLEDGKSQELGSSGRSTEEEMGWFALISPKLREGIFGGIEWSGSWTMRVANEAGTTSIRAGISDLAHDLQAGEIFDAPRRFVGFFQGDLDDAANASTIFARQYLLRARPANFPWVQFNTWFAYYNDLDEERLKKQVDAAAEMGVEIFYIDAGWYEGAPQHGDFSFGLGTWKENRDKFPSGLAAFSNYVHSKGMKFGLWVEPERVDLRYVGNDKEIKPEWLPKWLALPTAFSDNQALTAQICLGNPQARAWVKGWLARLIRDYQLDWIKWDNNIAASCDLPGEPGDQNYFHYKGLYEVLDYLRTAFPNVIIENCAAGGHRMDYALLRRTDIAWLSDETDPSYRVRNHVIGASYAFPPEYLNSWIVESYFEHFGDAEEKPDLLRAWMRSRMLGAFGIAREISDLSPELREVMADEIKRYKDTRAILARGRVYRLFPQSELSQQLEPPEEPDAAQFYDPNTRTGLVYLFQGSEAWSDRKILLRGLNPNFSYTVESHRKDIFTTQLGRDLMSKGITFTFDADYPSTVLFLSAPSTAITPQPTVARTATQTRPSTATPTPQGTKPPTPTRPRPTITTPTRAPTSAGISIPFLQPRSPTPTRTSTPNP